MRPHLKINSKQASALINGETPMSTHRPCRPASWLNKVTNIKAFYLALGPGKEGAGSWACWEAPSAKCHCFHHSTRCLSLKIWGFSNRLSNYWQFLEFSSKNILKRQYFEETVQNEISNLKKILSDYTNLNYSFLAINLSLRLIMSKQYTLQKEWLPREAREAVVHGTKLFWKTEVDSVFLQIPK